MDSARPLRLEDIEAARERIAPLPVTTHTRFADSIRDQLFLPEGVIRRPQVRVKPENRQETRAFKLRGALYFAAVHEEAIRIHGAVTASAGNHAQGVAYAVARVLGLPEMLEIFVPVGTPPTKLAGIEKYAGRAPRQVGATFDETNEFAQEFATESGAVFIPPYDDYAVIAGQGTIGLEILDEYPEVDGIVVPIGGGGLIAGIAFAVKEKAKLLGRDIKVIGVEEVGSACAHYARSRGRVERLPAALELAELTADGIAVKRVGAKCFPLIEECVDTLYAVLPRSLLIGAALIQVDDYEDAVVEGAGAAGAAVLVHGHAEPAVACAVLRREAPASALELTPVAELATCANVCVVASGGNARAGFQENAARIEEELRPPRSEEDDGR